MQQQECAYCLPVQLSVIIELEGSFLFYRCLKDPFEGNRVYCSCRHVF